MISTSRIDQTIRLLQSAQKQIPMPEEEKAFPSLYEFARAAWDSIEPGKTFVDGKHLQAICLHLEAVSEGRIKRLLINMPPRFCKSTLIRIIWPAWSWLRHPEHKWLCASYSLELSSLHNQACRRLIRSSWFQKHYGSFFQLSRDKNAALRFLNKQGGSMHSVSVGSSVTGIGGDTLLIDDPHSIREKESTVKRHGALEWYRTTWNSRLNDRRSGTMVVVGQRIHDMDLSGYLLSPEAGEEWVHLSLPAEYNPDYHCSTPIWSDWRTEKGDLLWPERFPAEEIETIRKTSGSMGYAALYDQRPVPADGGQFKKTWFRYYHRGEDGYVLHKSGGTSVVLYHLCWVILTVDLAISLKETADYTVISAWAVTPDRELLLLDRLRERLDNPQQQQAILQWSQRFNPNFIRIESTAYQLALVQQLAAMGLPVQAYNPAGKGDKAARASTAAVKYEIGDIYHPQDAVWLAEWESEILKFPMGENDDQVDTVSMAADAVRNDNAIHVYSASQARKIRGF